MQRIKGELLDGAAVLPGVTQRPLKAKKEWSVAQLNIGRYFFL